MPTRNLDEISVQILEAASRRFLYYGYKKTAMSEIAEDCNMSTGNLYRYFSSKLDIAEMFVHVLRGEHIENLRKVMKSTELSPKEKLREFFLEKFRLAYERFHDKPKAYELSTTLLAERPAVGNEWESAEGKVLGEILMLGDAEDVFAIEDPLKTAKILLDAGFRFTSPVVFLEGEYDELVTELHGVIDLVIDGFAMRALQRREKSQKMAVTS